MSLSPSSPVVLRLSTTFRPAHYNAGERRSQDGDLKGWWVGKQGSKGGYALIAVSEPKLAQMTARSGWKVVFFFFLETSVYFLLPDASSVPGTPSRAELDGIWSSSPAPGAACGAAHRWQSRTCRAAICAPSAAQSSELQCDSATTCRNTAPLRNRGSLTVYVG